MKEKETDRFISVQAVADKLSCTEHHVYYLIREGSIKAIKIGPRAIRVSWNSLQEFIAAGLIDPEDYFAPDDPDPELSSNIKTLYSNWMKR
ncbi:DNA binding domain-containing protein, excisionase family [Syntrophus gentianae]|uniref:DNA binding domain-containing protein, excisionase family n=1 Tax=Syntrophus gentianae TaxID=43775 RepID=A0A1H7XGV7_9BACT|nr:helix-turn-helix domain-containing protein [Syntrophus gentianae]SEM33026.1 DNA binding domain-containing protein, excisionase family [Syntrophus gentianae]